MTEKFNSRKFIITAGIEVLATALALAGVLSGDNWTTISLANVTAYNIANMGTAFAERDKK